jgi:hypothetical protein
MDAYRSTIVVSENLSFNSPYSMMKSRAASIRHLLIQNFAVSTEFLHCGENR